MKAIIRCKVTGYNDDPKQTVRTALAHTGHSISIISIQVKETNANLYSPYRYPRNVDPSFDRNYPSKNSMISSNRHHLSSFSSSWNSSNFEQAYNQPSHDPFKNETVEVVVEFALYNHSIGLYNPNLISDARKLITDAILLRASLQFVRFEEMPQLNPFESHLPYTMPNPRTTPSIFNMSTSLNPSQATNMHPFFSSHHEPTFPSSHSPIASFGHGHNRPYTTTIIPPSQQRSSLEFDGFEEMPQLHPFESHFPYAMPNPMTIPSPIIFNMPTSLNPSQATSHHKPTSLSSHSPIASFCTVTTMLRISFGTRQFVYLIYNMDFLITDLDSFNNLSNNIPFTVPI